MAIRIALFGQPRVVSEDGSRDYPLPRKTLHLLAYLILHRRRPPARDSVAFALFPDDDEEKARGALRRNLSYLLDALPDAKRYVGADLERVAWNAAPDARVDVVAFEEAIAAGRDDDAIAEYAGELLPTIYDDWTNADRERLRDAYHEALARSIASYRSQRRFDAATALAHRLLEEDPWREDVVRQLISVRYEAADRAGALAVFERFAERLRAEMDVDPMPETFALRDAVLRGARLAGSEPRRGTGATAIEPGLPFVGRTEAIEGARAAWQRAADGRAGVLFVSGEAGVGKSRFVTELARIVESEGGVAARGYTASGGEHRPYEAFIEALRGAPGIFEIGSDAALTDDRAARLRLFDLVRGRLKELTHARPMAFVLEDLHWAGASTIELLEYVVRRLEDAPVLIVATARSDELPRAHPLRALRRQLTGSGLAIEIVLERLSAQDATRAARAALPEDVDEAALARTVAWVDGVPLLLAEAVRDLAAGRVSSASTVSELVGERLERLSTTAETALVFGAVLGERFDLASLAAATAWRDDEILDAIGESLELGLVRTSARAPGLAFAFTHDLIRSAALARISAAERTRAHGLVARALSAREGAGGARAGEIAHHFAAAAEPSRAAVWFAKAARYALDVFANEDARESASAGIALCDGVDARQRALRFELVALREQSLGRMGALEQQRADARLLLELAAGDDARAAALERVFESHHEDTAARARTVAALGTLAATSALAAATFARCDAKDAFLLGNFERARTSFALAAERLERVGEGRAAMMARFMEINALARMGAFADAFAATERLRPVAEGSDDLPMRAEFHRCASSASAETRPDRALEDARRSLALALRIGDRYAEARARQNVGAVAGKNRLYAEALEQNARASAAYREVGVATGACDAALNTASVLLFCGDLEGGRRTIDAAGLQAAGEAPWLSMRATLLRGLFLSRKGCVEEAQARFLEVIERAEVLGAALYRTRAQVQLGGLLAAGGALDEAARWLDAALASLPDLVGDSAIAAEASALAARVSATCGRPEEAIERASRAVRLVQTKRAQSYSEIAWNAAAAYALAGDATAAAELARSSIAAAIEDAWCMPPDLAESYLALPFHRQALEFVWGRQVALRPVSP